MPLDDDMDIESNWCLGSIKTHYTSGSREPGPFFGQRLFSELVQRENFKISGHWTQFRSSTLWQLYVLGISMQIISGLVWTNWTRSSGKTWWRWTAAIFVSGSRYIGKIHAQLQNQQSFWQSVSGGLEIIPNWNATINLL